MDPIIESFRSRQHEHGLALAAASDILQLRALTRNGGVPQHYVARFHCQTFMLEPDGQVAKADFAEMGIYFPDHYLREANPYEVLTWLRPASCFHPNVRGRAICIGERFLRPGTPLVEILIQLHAVITWRKWAAHAPLNESAAQWARNNQHLFPSDPRPLKRRVLNVAVNLNANSQGAS